MIAAPAPRVYHHCRHSLSYTYTQTITILLKNKTSHLLTAVLLATVGTTVT